MKKNKVRITTDFDSGFMPTVWIDDKIIPVRSFIVRWDVSSVPEIELSLFLKSSEININGVVKINELECPDSLAKQIFETLKQKVDSGLQAIPKKV